MRSVTRLSGIAIRGAIFRYAHLDKVLGGLTARFPFAGIQVAETFVQSGNRSPGSGLSDSLVGQFLFWNVPKRRRGRSAGGASRLLLRVRLRHRCIAT